MAQRAYAEINVYQDNDRNYKFTFKNADNTAFNFSGATAVKLQVKQNLFSPSVLFTIAATDAQNGNNWAGGIAVFTISKAQSLLFNGDGVFEVDIDRSVGRITPVYGNVLVKQQVAT